MSQKLGINSLFVLAETADPKKSLQWTLTLNRQVRRYIVVSGRIVIWGGGRWKWRTWKCRTCNRRTRNEL